MGEEGVEADEDENTREENPAHPVHPARHADAFETSVKARSRIRENFSIATVYNIIAVPFAIAGFATPLMAALAMSTSSITVSLNALRLR